MFYTGLRLSLPHVFVRSQCEFAFVAVLVRFLQPARLQSLRVFLFVAAGLQFNALERTEVRNFLYY